MWSCVLLLIGVVVGGVLGWIGHVIKARTPTKDHSRTLADNEQTRRDARRAEDLETFRWAAELAVSSDEGKRRLGVDQLKHLVRSKNLYAEDLYQVRVAIGSALSPTLDAIASDEDSQVRLDAPRAEEEQR
jgi:hypothetical protein